MSSVWVVNGVHRNGASKLLRVCLTEELAEAVAKDKRASMPTPFTRVDVERWHLYGTAIGEPKK